jgi:ribonuclease Z
MDFYEWRSWPNFFPVSFHRLPEQEGWLALERGGMRLFTSPVQHLLPTIGLRIEFSQTGKSLAYSCDTEPCPQVERLAAGVDVLIHEATGAVTGHSSPAQAGEMARKAEAGALYLIHYANRDPDVNRFVEQARAVFQGPVALAQDLMTISFD